MCIRDRVPVEHRRAVARSRRGDGDDQDRRAVVEAMDLDVEVGEASSERPIREQLDRPIDVPVLDPLGVEARRKTGDGGEGRDRLEGVAFEVGEVK